MMQNKVGRQEALSLLVARQTVQTGVMQRHSFPALHQLRANNIKIKSALLSGFTQASRSRLRRRRRRRRNVEHQMSPAAWRRQPDVCSKNRS